MLISYRITRNQFLRLPLGSQHKMVHRMCKSNKYLLVLPFILSEYEGTLILIVLYKKLKTERPGENHLNT